MWGLTPADIASIVGAVLWLVLLEGLLSGDNALVLAVMVRHLPPEQRKRALRYGIWGAFGFRLVAVLLANLVLQFWWLKVIGGLYLLQLAIRHFIGGNHGDDSQRTSRFGSGFWGTVISVEMADIAFSIDSILAAVATARGLSPRIQNTPGLTIGIVYLGGILGILMMRLVAGYFLTLLDRFKGLAVGAYVLVGWIGLKLIGGGLHDAFKDTVPNSQGWRANLPDGVKSFPWEMNAYLFWGGMVTIVVLSLIIKPSKGTTDTPADHLHANPTANPTPDEVHIDGAGA